MIQFWCRCNICKENFPLTCKNYREAESKIALMQNCPVTKHDVSHSKKDWCRIFGTQLEHIGDS